MPLFPAILRALLPLFLLIGTGYALKKRGILHAAHVPVLNGLVINVTLPALVVGGLANAPSLPLQSAALPLALMGAQALCLLTAHLVGRAGGWTRPQQGALLLTSTFGNTGFLGYPVTLALMPSHLPEAILLDQFGMTLPLYTLAPLFGAVLGSAGGEQKGAAKRALLRFLRSPVCAAIVVGSVVRLVPWPHSLHSVPLLREVGNTVSRCLALLGAATTPVVLVALGMALRPAAALQAMGKTLAACGVKLIVCPAAMWGLCMVLHLHGDLRRVGILASAMPTAVMASVLAGENDLAGDYAVGVVCAGTLLSAVTVPVALALLGG